MYWWCLSLVTSTIGMTIIGCKNICNFFSWQSQKSAVSWGWPFQSPTMLEAPGKFQLQQQFLNYPLKNYWGPQRVVLYVGLYLSIFTMEETLNIYWKDWCWSSNTLATWWEELTLEKRPWCWERLKAGGEGDNRGWDGWMASLTQWTGTWSNSGRW